MQKVSRQPGSLCPCRGVVKKSTHFFQANVLRFSTQAGSAYRFWAKTSRTFTACTPVRPYFPIQCFEVKGPVEALGQTIQRHSLSGSERPVTRLSKSNYKSIAGAKRPQKLSANRLFPRCVPHLSRKIGARRNSCGMPLWFSLPEKSWQLVYRVCFRIMRAPFPNRPWLK